MTAVENLDAYSAHSHKHHIEIDPDRLGYPHVIDFVNSETTPIHEWDFDNDPILEGLRKRLGLDMPLEERVTDALK